MLDKEINDLGLLALVGETPRTAKRCVVYKLQYNVPTVLAFLIHEA
jgi:hypothetical protein